MSNVLLEAADRLESWIQVANGMAGDSTFVSSEVIRMFGYLLGTPIARELVKTFRESEERHEAFHGHCLWCGSNDFNVPFPCPDIMHLVKVAAVIVNNKHV